MKSKKARKAGMGDEGCIMTKISVQMKQEIHSGPFLTREGM